MKGGTMMPELPGATGGEFPGPCYRFAPAVPPGAAAPAGAATLPGAGAPAAPGASRWRVLHGDLLLPVVVLRESALLHNARVMADYCRGSGVSLAPHAKTHMSPELAALQVDSGAWGLTVANAAQARVFHAFGFRRLLIANQVVDEQALRWMAAALRGDPELEVYCLVDSEAGTAIMDKALAAAGAVRPVPVLVELGYPGGRSGCRSLREAADVAAAVRGKHRLRLAGVECYEGSRGGTPDEATLAGVDALLGQVRDLAGQLDRAGCFGGCEEIIVSAGGSAFFDRVVSVLTPPPDLSRPVRTVLRSGSYLSHDHGAYQTLSPFGTRLPDRPRLRPACELWARVTSRPEPGLAILGFGKRDCPYDLGLPVPLTVVKPDGTSRAAAGEVVRLNDQHAYLRTGAADDLAVGDLISLGMSHPCTTFDKWRVMPVVDDDYQVIRTIRTFF